MLDIAQNSVKAGAKLIGITIAEESAENRLTITVADNGCGMSEEFLRRVRDPFTTTRTTRKVGMGISLFEAAAAQCGGGLEITSQEGVGTTLTAWFERSHIDRAPVGDMASTMVTLISGTPETDFCYTRSLDGASFVFDTREVRQVLEGIPLDTPEVLTWIAGSITEETETLFHQE